VALVFFCLCSDSVTDVENKLSSHFKGANMTLSGGKIKPSSDMVYTIRIPRGATMNGLGSAVYSDLEPLRNFNLGGIKLLYELSGDLSGYTNANRIPAGKTVTFYSIKALRLKLMDMTSSKNIVGRIVQEDLIFVSGRAYFIAGTGLID
jgi:hypothetical protein